MATKPISPDEYFAVEFISKQLQLDKFTDSQIVDIRKAFQGSAKRMLDYAEKKYTAKYGKGGWTRDRYLKVLQDVAKLDESLRTSLVDKTKDIGKAVYISELAKFEDIVSVKGLSSKFEHINLSPEYLKAFNNKMAFDNKSLAHWVNYSFDKEVQEKIKNEIMADVIVGSSNQAIIKRLQQAYSDVDRTLIESMTRTHIQKANTVAFLDVAKQNSDIIKRVRWLATLDQRCCIICGALDGKDFDMNSLPYSPPIHPRCRCIVTPITSTWKELGVNMEELDNIRPDNFNKLKPMVTGKTYSQRFKDFTDDQKLDLLGKTRFELIKGGKLDFQDLVNFKTGELYRLEELDRILKK